MEPTWVSLRAARSIHESQLARNGGLPGIRDEGSLISALMRPQNLFHYASEPPSIERFAAAYAFGICSNHPFNDGNKRTAFLVMYVFLRRNSLTFSAPESEVVDVFLRLADGRMSEEEIAAWISDWTSPE